MPEAVFAHSLPGEPRTRWEDLPDHLCRVGATAEAFATKFGAGKAALAAGLLHDIGKNSAAFQAYIGGSGSSPDHSTAGAVEAIDLFPGSLGRLIAFAIAGHHAGLADGAGASGSLDARLARRADLPDYRGWREMVPELPAELTLSFPSKWGDPGYTLAFLGRMIFSCLVDADFIETERFYADAAGERRERGGHTSLTALRERLDRHLDLFADTTGPLNARRAEILRHARAKAALPPGLFTMTVPTGGGKTLASLAFALDHAIAHGLDRVVYIIPYTSIIEQTAAVFRDALRDANGDAPDVLEHHGNVEWDADETDADGRDALAKLRRAAENWDVPVVVTTAVQFFESLHASRTSRCRKLHNLARSVIVLDEAQTLPLPLLRPCMAAIDELANNYRASVVLCTATQPALRQQDGFRNGLDIPDERELAPDPQGLYEAFSRRVVVRNEGPVGDAEIAARFAEQERMLCVVNSRAHAQALFNAIGDLPGRRHLSTLMSPAHRRFVLGEIRADLDANRPVRLVSTSLIEAGVDLSLEEAWRAQTGLDSIAQVAGRVNRHGEMDVPGRIVVFESIDHPSPRMFKPMIDAALRPLTLPDPLGPRAIKLYFRRLYDIKGDAEQSALDAAVVQGQRGIIRAIAATTSDVSFPYASIAAAFRMIDQAVVPVLVPWPADNADFRDLRSRLACPLPSRDTRQQAQQSIVNIPRSALPRLYASGKVQPLAEFAGTVLYVTTLYDCAIGFELDPYSFPAENGPF